MLDISRSRLIRCLDGAVSIFRSTMIELYLGACGPRQSFVANLVLEDRDFLLRARVFIHHDDELRVFLGRIQGVGRGICSASWESRCVSYLVDGFDLLWL